MSVRSLFELDDELLFRRNATIAPPTALEQGRRRLPAVPIPTVPLAEERLLPAGGHKIQVSISLGRRAGQAQEVTAAFNPGERHTLEIQFFPDAPRGNGPEGEPNRFRIVMK